MRNDLTSLDYAIQVHYSDFQSNTYYLLRRQ